MIELIKSIKTVSVYNEMSFDDFVIRLEKFLDKEIDFRTKENWRFSGLNNIDFLKVYIYNIKPFSYEWWVFVGKKAWDLSFDEPSGSGFGIYRYCEKRLKKNL